MHRNCFGVLQVFTLILLPNLLAQMSYKAQALKLDCHISSSFLPLPGSVFIQVIKHSEPQFPKDTSQEMIGRQGPLM